MFRCLGFGVQGLGLNVLGFSGTGVVAQCSEQVKCVAVIQQHLDLLEGASSKLRNKTCRSKTTGSSG